MTRGGMLYQKIRDTAFNEEAFKQSILEIKQRCSEIGLINPKFVCDNARIHYYRAMMPTLEAAGINIVYLSPIPRFSTQSNNFFLYRKIVSINQKPNPNPN
ncbi:hypothetical protein CDIK_4149 [Cucumispora dikerogammari]|nr:hypothetical protein CDIK_4149 [Cucumispora dikerogammari]